MKPTTLLTALAFSLFSVTVSLAQDEMPTDGIFTPGTSTGMTVTRIEPVCWLNSANEFNVYVPGKDGGTLLTLLNEKKPDIGSLPKFSEITATDYSFILTTEDKQEYYFAVESKEEKQMLDYMLRLLHPKFEKTVYGHGLAKHTVNDVSLDKLKAAKSVYDVLGKS